MNTVNTKPYKMPVDATWLINFCIVEPAAIKTNSKTHSKKNTKPHEAYSADDMPSWKLASYVSKGLQAGVGVEPIKVAKCLVRLASRNEKVPLHLPLTADTVNLIKANLEKRLKMQRLFET